MMSTASPFLGIDFGTSRSAMTWFNPETGHAEVIRNLEGEEETPSLIYIGENETLVGNPAREIVEDERQRACVIASVKRDIRKNMRYPVPGRPTPVEVAA